MSSELKTSFDLELNPFENSFATKELLPQHQRPLGFADSPSASGTSSGSNSFDDVLSTSTVDKTTTTKDASKIVPNVSVSVSLVPPAPVTEHPPVNNSNKHNLRILNFQSLDSERLPGLTPPLFTPGGRRLPPIHFSPGGALGSPGTPSHLWSSLLTATAQNPDYASLMRKLGLTPNETNLRTGLTPNDTNLRTGLTPNDTTLRTGLTPSIMAQQGFNFNLNTPGGFLNGQITPGLQHLFALANGTESTTDAHGLHALHGPTVANSASNGTSMSNATAVPNAASIPSATTLPNTSSMPVVVPAKTDIKETVIAEESDEGHAVKEEQSEAVKRPAEEGSRTRKSRRKKDEKPREQTEDQKRKQFLERNRVAAYKCRQRKKQLFTKMESELSFYSNGYREMSAQVTQLRNQLLQVREVLLAHRECPALVNAVGGFQQLQNILSQSDYAAQVAANAQPNYTSMPSTIPTTLNAPVKSEPLVNGLQNVNEVGVNGQVGQVGVGQIPVSSGHVGHVGSVQVEQVSTNVPGDLNMRMPYLGDVDGFQNDVIEGTLRPIQSTSNLQNGKLASDAYGLRSLASMADLPSEANAEVKHFEI